MSIHRFPPWLDTEKKFEIACEPGRPVKFAVRLFDHRTGVLCFTGYGPTVTTAAKRALAARQARQKL